MLVGLVVVAALGQDEVCAGALSAEHWREAMDAIDVAIGDFHGALANELLDGLGHELRCLRAPADPVDLGRLARQRALMAFYGQDTQEAGTWGVLARSTAGGAPWPEAVPVPDAFHAFLAELPDAVVGGPAELGLAPPKGGAVLVDGRIVLAPTVALDTTHFLQVADKRGGVLENRWQHGAAFPEALLGEPRPLEAPKWYAEPPAPPPLVVPAPSTDEVAAVAPLVAVEVAPVVVPVEAVVDVATVAPTAPAAVAPLDRTVAREARDRMFAEREAPARCPWKADPRSVEARPGEVRVNKRAYPVRSAQDQAAFRAILLSCGELRAARKFAKWRDARAHLSLTAGREREGMERALLADEDRKRR